MKCVVFFEERFEYQPYMASEKFEKAKALQRQLAKKVSLKPFKGNARIIAGADISFNLKENIVYAVLAVWDCEQERIVDHSSAIEEVSFPYVPGYLSFREVPPLLKAWESLRNKPEIVMLDGHGIIHPRRFGLACHFGLEAGVATLGCAKKPFVGEFKMPHQQKGSHTIITVDNEERGFAYRSRSGVKPVYISPGTGMSLQDCLNIAQQAGGKYRILEPTRHAHRLSNQLRQLVCTG